MTRTKNRRRGQKKKPGNEANQDSKDEEAQPDPSLLVVAKEGEKLDKTQIEELVDQAERSLVSSDLDRVIQLCQHVLNSQPDHLRALETLALSQLELGYTSAARKLFLRCLNNSTANPQPTVHLYLAQLSQSPQESLKHFETAFGLLKTKLNLLLQSKQQSSSSGDENQSPKLSSPEHQAQKNEEDTKLGTIHWSVDEAHIRRSCSRALVGMTEIYLTDLCFEPAAEEKCLEYLATASLLDPTDPEPLQTLASVRLSQSEPELAKEALLLSWSLWREKGPTTKGAANGKATAEDEDDNKVPMGAENMDEDEENPEEEEEGKTRAGLIDVNMIVEGQETIKEDKEDEADNSLLPLLDTRIQWAKLAIECNMWTEAIEVLHQCEAENDEDGEVAYLLSLSWYLLAQSRPAPDPNLQPDVPQVPAKLSPGLSVAVGDGLGRSECLLEAKECIDTCLQLHKRLGDASGVDESILNHVIHMNQELQEAGIGTSGDPEADKATGDADEEQSDFDDQDLVADAEWVDVSDVEMN